MSEKSFETGVVKFFNMKSRFGFIRVDSTGEEIYVHGKDCLDEITDADKVRFTIGSAKRGPVAQEVQQLRG